jgi:hypothetical protein
MYYDIIVINIIIKMAEYKTWVFILFFIILIIIVTYVSVKNFLKKEKIQEGINWPKVPSPKEIGDKMRADFDRIGDKAREVGDKMKGGFEEIGNKMAGFFKDLLNRFKKMGGGLLGIFDGIGDQFVGIGEGLRLGFNDIGLLFEYTGEFILTYAFCGVKFITNLKTCFFYYMIDTILQIMYLPARLFIFIIWLSLYKGVYKLEAKFWNNIRRLDNFNFNYTGVYFTRWPKNIRDLCYNCKRLKVSVLKRKAQDVHDDFDIKMPQLLKKGIDRIKRGSNDLLGAFK